MSGHPLNKFLRLMMEFAALAAFGMFGYFISAPLWRIPMAILFPLGMAVIWGVFAVRDDPSRSGKTVVHTPGWIRLILELALLAAAALVYWAMGYLVMFWIMAVAIAVHYMTSLDRVRWLLRQN